MKRKLIFLSLILITTGLNAQIPTPKLKFILTGRISGKDINEIYLKYHNNEALSLTDTCKVRNGKFTFSGLIKEPTLATLIANTKSNADLNKVEIFIEPGVMNIVLAENKFSHATLNGSKTQKEFELFNKKRDPLNKKIDSLADLNTKIYENLEKATNAEAKEKLYLKLNDIDDLKNSLQHQLDQITILFIDAPASYISPLVLQSVNNLSLEDKKKLYDKWTQGVKNSFYGFHLYTEIHTYENTLVGQMAPDFETVDVNGKPLKLSDFRGKNFILLDLWASWCVPCRALTPHLKELYRKYHSKGFDIIGISCDENKAAWQKAIKQDSIDIWHQIPIVQNQSLPFVYNPSQDDLRFKYEFHPIPIQILLDKTGKIVGCWKGRSEENTMELDKKLAELMGCDIHGISHPLILGFNGI